MGSYFARDPKSHNYKGAWQINARDIDPTILVRNIPDLNWKTSPQCWWQPHKIQFQDESVDEQFEWVENDENISSLPSLLEVQNPTNQMVWLLLQGDYSWYEKKRTNDNGQDMPYRNLWLNIHCFMVKKEYFEDVKSAILACEHVRNWMPHQSELHQIYVGEFPLYGASESYDDEYEIPKCNKLPCPIYLTSVSYNTLSSYDGSASNTSASLPSKNLMSGMDLQRVGREYDYYQNNQLAVYCPHTKSLGPQALLASKEILTAYLSANDLVLFWGIQGEKMLIGNDASSRVTFRQGCVTGFRLFCRVPPS